MALPRIRTEDSCSGMEFGRGLAWMGALIFPSWDLIESTRSFRVRYEETGRIGWQTAGMRKREIEDVTPVGIGRTNAGHGKMGCDIDLGKGILI